MKKLATFIAAPLIALLLTACDSGVSGTPMPFTEAGMNQLNAAASRVNQQAFMQKGLSVEKGSAESVQLVVDFNKEFFEAAGYSLEASLVKAAEGLSGSKDERKAFYEANYYGLGGIMPIAKMLYAVEESTGHKLDDFMHPDAAEAVRKLVRPRS